MYGKYWRTTDSLISSRLHTHSGTEDTITHLEIQSLCGDKALRHRITTTNSPNWDRNTLINPFMVCAAVSTFGLSGPRWLGSDLVWWCAWEQSLRCTLFSLSVGDKRKLVLAFRWVIAVQCPAVSLFSRSKGRVDRFFPPCSWLLKHHLGFLSDIKC